ncbi:MAG: hypothetical protein M3444_02850 [Acidobacteriota bacterium]|nr:hypothetical protein [Acidobacteriota bacterium]
MPPATSHAINKAAAAPHSRDRILKQKVVNSPGHVPFPRPPVNGVQRQVAGGLSSRPANKYFGVIQRREIKTNTRGVIHTEAMEKGALEQLANEELNAGNGHSWQMILRAVDEGDYLGAPTGSSSNNSNNNSSNNNNNGGERQYDLISGLDEMEDIDLRDGVRNLLMVRGGNILLSFLHEASSAYDTLTVAGDPDDYPLADLIGNLKRKTLLAWLERIYRTGKLNDYDFLNEYNNVVMWGGASFNTGTLYRLRPGASYF